MSALKEARDFLFRFYEFDSMALAELMQADLANNPTPILDALYKVQRSIAETIERVVQEVQPPRAVKPAKAASPGEGKPAGKTKGLMTAEQKLESRKLSSLRYIYRSYGYICPRNSKVIYYTDSTDRRVRTERNNKHGFVFRKLKNK